MVRRLILEFPHGEDVKFCDYIARNVERHARSRVSIGGYTMTYMPLTQEDEKHRGCEFADDEMTFEFGYLKEEKK
jgi:hypothetical protein